MKTKCNILTILLLIFLSGAFACVEHRNPDRPEKEECDLFLLIGQSNMAGRGTMLPADTIIMEGVWLLDSEGQPVPASNPLNRYSSIRKRLDLQQIGPGYGFARKLHAVTGHKILLVVNARGGSSLREWMPGGSYFAEAVRRTREAMRFARLRAILWHQGESDSSAPVGYLTDLNRLVDSLRRVLHAPELPFIAGEIAPWHKNAARFNPLIQRICDTIARSGWVSSAGCTPLRNEQDPHFDRDGQLLLGERYAEKVLEMCYE
ncbi:sialate O-acetylesterase [Alistipes senegalensis]|uniref:sialate O-acetylesterase n=1 Tax=Alistipes senegalensis TaxID=1288121 RepID=UPI0018AB3A08|nr:sialate O-acetylesterase [Alistipes senegalensis]